MGFTSAPRRFAQRKLLTPSYFFKIGTKKASCFHEAFKIGSNTGLGSNFKCDHLMEDYEIILRVIKGGVLE
jgi:hypothetical protein